MFIPKSLDVQITYAKALLYSSSFISAPDDAEYVVQPFPTGGDRFAAGEIAKRKDPSQFTRTGMLCFNQASVSRKVVAGVSIRC